MEAGPLSRAARNRELEEQAALNAANDRANNDVNAAAAHSCFAGNCGAAGDMAGQARQASRSLAMTASSHLAEEERARNEIRRAVKQSGASPAEIQAFGKLFTQSAFPTNQEIRNSLPPSLHDAAHAFRTTLANEARLRQAVQKATNLEASTSNLQQTNQALTNRAASFSASKLAPATLASGHPAREPASLPPSAQADLHSFPASAGSASFSLPPLPPLPPLPSIAGERRNLSADAKKRSAPPGTLAGEDKSLLAGLFEDLRNDISKNPAPPAGNQVSPAAALATPASGSGPAISAGIPPVAILSTEALGSSAGAGGRSLASNEQPSPDVSLFVRVHSRIELRAEAAGLVQRR